MKKLALLSVFVACSAHAQGVKPGTKPFAGVLGAGLCYSVFTSANVKTGSECAYNDSGNGAFEFRDRTGAALLRLTTSFAAPILELQGTGTWRSSGSLSIYDESGNDGSGSEATVHSVRVGGNERLAITNKGNLKSTGGVYTTVGAVLALKSNLAAGAGPGIIYDTDNAITGTVHSWRVGGVEKANISASGNIATVGNLTVQGGTVSNSNGVAMSIIGNKAAGAGPDIVLDTTNAITGTMVSIRKAGVEQLSISATGGISTNGGVSASGAVAGSSLTVSSLKAPIVHGSGTAQMAIESGTQALTTGAATVTFSTAFASAPVCVCEDGTAVLSAKCTTSATQLTIAGTGSDVIAYICIGAN